MHLSNANTYRMLRHKTEILPPDAHVINIINIINYNLKTTKDKFNNKLRQDKETHKNYTLSKSDLTIKLHLVR